MNGRDAAGRAVSLLNNEPGDRLSAKAAPGAGPLALSTRFPPWPRSQPSPAGIPPTPELLRSRSSSSQRTTDSSPSPTTPAYALDPRLLPKQAAAPISKLAEPALVQLHSPRSVYPAMSPPVETSDVGSVCSPSIASMSPPASPMTVSAKPMPKRYPCQFAERLGCREMFTTSGHASRHAKKHTGEKNVPCPKCPKKFARKDNMKQHLKTHENGGGGGGGGSSRGADGSSSTSPEDGPRPPKVQRRGDGIVSSTARPSAGTAAVTTAAASTTSDAKMRPQLHRSSATFAVPQRDFSLYDGGSAPTSNGQLPSPVDMFCHGPSTLTPGLQALLIAADAQRPTRYGSGQ